MHIKNTIPAEFVFNSALMKNIENTLMKQHSTINNERMITEIQHRLQTESNEILSDLYLQALDMLYSKKHHHEVIPPRRQQGQPCCAGTPGFSSANWGSKNVTP